MRLSFLAAISPARELVKRFTPARLLPVHRVVLLDCPTSVAGAQPARGAPLEQPLCKPTTHPCGYPNFADAFTFQALPRSTLGQPNLLLEFRG
eukprot:g12613.t1